MTTQTQPVQRAMTGIAQAKTKELSMKPIGVDAAQSALNTGAKIEGLPESFYSGGRVYTHVLHTAAGHSFRIARQTFQALTFPTHPCVRCDVVNCPGCKGRFVGMKAVSQARPYFQDKNENEALRLADYLEQVLIPQHPESNGIQKAATELRRLDSEIERLCKERNEADQRAGAAEREKLGLHDDVKRFEREIRRITEEWGAHRNTSFDDVWQEALTTKAELAQLRESKPLSDEQWQALADVFDGIINRELKNKISAILNLPEE